MRIAKTEIWKAAATDKERKVLNGVHYNAEKGRLEACDGFILAMCSVQNGDNLLGSGIIPADTIKEAYRRGRAKSKSPTVDEGPEGYTPGCVAAFPQNDAEALTEKGETSEPIEGKYPNVDQIVPGFTDNYEHVATIDAKLLYQLAQAICECDGNTSNPPLRVRIYKDKSGNYSPLIVKPGFQLVQEHMGLIMPIQDLYPPKV